MQFLDLKTQLKDFLVFSNIDIEKTDPLFHRQRLSEWQRKGYVIKLIKGFYIFSDLPINELTLFILANRVYDPSYVSLEMALSIHGVIPEGVYSVTSITSLRTKKITTPVGNFLYRHLPPEMMFGYELQSFDGHIYKIASIEKAILDYLYFNPKINDSKALEGVRFVAVELKEKINTDVFTKYLKAFSNKSLEKRAYAFLTYIKNYA